MGKYKRYKNSVERFLSGEKGKRFFNFAYSIGAAIVILGALFKILYLPFGSLMLSIGMGIEVLMFCLSAFEKPQKEYNWDEVFPVLRTRNPEDRPQFNGGGGGGGIYYGGSGSTPAAPTGEASAPTTGEYIAPSGGNTPSAYSNSDLAQCVAQLTAISEQLAQLTAQPTQAQEIAVGEVPDLSSPTQGYATQMDALNRNLSGLNAMYEMQLRGVSAQLSSLEQVNTGLQTLKQMYQNAEVEGIRYRAESEKMTQLMNQLNSVYERMLAAMTINQAAQPQPREAENKL